MTEAWDRGSRGTSDSSPGPYRTITTADNATSRNISSARLVLNEALAILLWVELRINFS